MAKNNSDIRILVVDDDPDILFATTRTLKKENYEVLTANSGQQCLDKVEQEQPDLILLDVELPDIPGTEICHNLKNNPSTQHIPIILISGILTSTHDQSDGLDFGADGYIARPVSNRELVSRVKSMVRFVKSEKRYRDIIENAGDSIILHESNGQILHVNTQATHELGYSYEEMLTMSIQDISLVANQIIIREVARTVISGEQLTFVTEHIRKDGSNFPVEVRVSQIDYGGDQVILSIARDITDRKQAENDLKSSKDYLVNILNNIGDPVFVKDDQHKLTLVNDAFCSTFGRFREDIIGKTLVEDVPPNEQDHFLAIDRQVLANGKENSCEETLTVKGSKTSTILTKKTRYVAENGDKYLIGVIRDITERKQAEKDLSESEARYRSLIENQRDLVCRFAPDGKLNFVNEIYCTFFSMSPKELIGSKWQPLLVDDDVELMNEILSTLSHKNPTIIIEIRVRSGKGEIHWMQFSNSGIFDSQGNLLEIQSVGRDITDRKKSEEALLKSEERYARAVRGTTDGLWDWSVVTNEYYFSPRCKELLGFAEDELTNEYETFFSRVHPHDVSRVQEAINAHLEQCIPYNIKHRLRTKSGDYKWFHVRGMAERDEHGKAVIMSGSITDITEFIQAEVEKEKLERQLLQTQKLEAVGQLASGIAHEINSPSQYIGTNIAFLDEAFSEILTMFASIQADSDVLKQEKSVSPKLAEILEKADWEYLSEEIPNAIKQSKEGILRVSSIVQAMKEFSHPGGRSKEPADLNHIIANTVTVARNEWKYVANVESNFDKNIPLTPVFINEMGQVVLILLVNAAQAIAEKLGDNPTDEKGTITITTSVLENGIQVRMSDTGMGIPKPVRPRIFDPFYTTKMVGKGTGQGLAIAYDVVTAKHGGKIDFTTEIGQGTQFTIWLPTKTEND